MTEPTPHDPPAGDDETSELDHDASEGGPINAPGDEPDPESPTEVEQGDAGRLAADDL